MAEHSFYAVGHGKKPGVYEKWTDVQEQACFPALIKDFPQPVYKKFATKEEAEEYVKVRRPERISLEVDEEADKFYAVARGKVVGIFTDYNEVKNHIADYPQPLYKKFEKLDEAKAYYKKYSNGEEDGNPKESKAHNTATDNNEKEVKETENQTNKGPSFYAVAYGHKTGVFKTWEECLEATKDFKGAKFKKFDNEEDAKLFVEGRNIKEAGNRVKLFVMIDLTKTTYILFLQISVLNECFISSIYFISSSHHSPKLTSEIVEDRKRAHSPDDVADGVEDKSAKKG
uniref:ribonuclease H n=1 Tax=Wuchereria bancrofti TaxID=6293 RepID=A0A1I8EQH3_WUCBA